MYGSWLNHAGVLHPAGGTGAGRARITDLIVGGAVDVMQANVLIYVTEL
jgi:hypothetical protein